MATIDSLTFDNAYSRLPDLFHQRVAPTPFPSPWLVGFSREAAALIDLDPSVAGSPEFVEVFSGNRTLPGMTPIAMKYAGHQFGGYVPQLGDGRAILLGQVRNRAGESWDLHLKGSGPTAFSRMGDGRAVLRSSIREFLASEAMYHLNVPTTRALCVIGGQHGVYRETEEPGAVVVRMAPSHVRFGSFEVFHYRGQHEAVALLADHVIDAHFPALAEDHPGVDRYAAFFREVCRRTARLMAMWQSVGFMHGVMNTDNMSILGSTLDYGPYGFMEEFDPGHICNHSDESGRYAFDQQPRIGYWNLGCLANALSSLIPAEELQSTLEGYPDDFNGALNFLMSGKLGLFSRSPEVERTDTALWMDLLGEMAGHKLDYTDTFRGFCRGIIPDALGEWGDRYRARLGNDELPASRRQELMLANNPKYILRNWLAQVAIEKAERGDASEVARLLDVLRRPFDEQPEMEHYAQPAPAWAKDLVVSCSS